jgi:hypothetical protein
VTSPALADRYGAPARWRRPLLVGASTLLALLFTGWLAWTTLFHATPQVASELVAFEVVDDHTATATLDVDLDLDDGAEATCRVRASAEDHMPVGDLAFTPTAGRQEVEIRTERRATAVDLLGCTAPGQPRPR